MSPPYCPHCGCVINREGVYCQSCRNEHGYESDNCVCYEDCPGNCVSKLEHYCCCTIVIDIDDCRSNNHDCVCNHEDEDCRANYHK